MKYLLSCHFKAYIMSLHDRPSSQTTSCLHTTFPSSQTTSCLRTTFPLFTDYFMPRHKPTSLHPYMQQKRRFFRSGATNLLSCNLYEGKHTSAIHVYNYVVLSALCNSKLCPGSILNLINSNEVIICNALNIEVY